MHALSSLVAPKTLKQVGAQLIQAAGAARRETASRETPALNSSSAGPSKASLSKLLRTAPFLFADELPRRLCKAPPPWGLLSKDVSQLGAPSNWSKVRRVNRTRDHALLCSRYAERLQHNARNGTRPPLPWNRTCAIVGSGGSLIGSRAGGAIDAHDAVMRFNAAPAGGEWSADVGSRTTLRLFTDKTVGLGAKAHKNPADARAGGEGHLVYCMATWLGKCMHAGAKPQTAGQSKLWLINPVFVRHLRAHLDEHGGRGRLPSAGLVGISFALLAWCVARDPINTRHHAQGDGYGCGVCCVWGCVWACGWGCRWGCVWGCGWGCRWGGGCIRTIPSFSSRIATVTARASRSSASATQATRARLARAATTGSVTGTRRNTLAAKRDTTSGLRNGGW